MIVKVRRQVALQTKINRNEPSQRIQWNTHFRDICTLLTFDFIVNIKLEMNNALVKADTYLSTFKRIQNCRHKCLSLRNFSSL